MEPIEEQWNEQPLTDIMSKSWIHITNAKKEVKIWILDRGESWAHSHHNDKTRL